MVCVEGYYYAKPPKKELELKHAKELITDMAEKERQSLVNSTTYRIVDLRG